MNSNFMSCRAFQSTEMLRKYFPGCVYALFIATTQVIYEPDDEYEPDHELTSAHCSDLQLIVFWLTFTICCTLIVTMGQTHENSKRGGSYYNISKCFHWKFYSFNKVIHIVGALISFAALALCGHDASICIGLDPKDTRYVPIITTTVFLFLWQGWCPTMPKCFKRHIPKVKSPNGNKPQCHDQNNFGDSSKTYEDDMKQKHIEMKTCSDTELEDQSVISLTKRLDEENFSVELKQEDPSKNWAACYATFPRYNCVAFNTFQAMILTERSEWGRMVLLGLYIIQSLLIIIQQMENRSKSCFLFQDVLIGVLIWLNFTAITIFQHDTAEYILGGVGCFSNLIPFAVPMLNFYVMAEFATGECLMRYSE